MQLGITRKWLVVLLAIACASSVWAAEDNDADKSKAAKSAHDVADSGRSAGTSTAPPKGSSRAAHLKRGDDDDDEDVDETKPVRSTISSNSAKNVTRSEETFYDPYGFIQRFIDKMKRKECLPPQDSTLGTIHARTLTYEQLIDAWNEERICIMKGVSSWTRVNCFKVKPWFPCDGKPATCTWPTETNATHSTVKPVSLRGREHHLSYDAKKKADDEDYENEDDDNEEIRKDKSSRSAGGKTVSGENSRRNKSADRKNKKKNKKPANLPTDYYFY